MRKWLFVGCARAPAFFFYLGRCLPTSFISFLISLVEQVFHSHIRVATQAMFAQWLALRNARLRYLFLQGTCVEDVALVYAQENILLVTINPFLVLRNLKKFLACIE